MNALVKEPKNLHLKSHVFKQKESKVQHPIAPSGKISNQFYSLVIICSVNYN